MPAPTAKHQSLTPGHRLEEYEVRRELGSGGFGITYVAWDHNLEREVVIKENMPFCAFRDPADSHVYPRSNVGEDAETFAWSLTNFVTEARTLAKFDHPNIVRVLRVFEANGTAYFVMPRVAGKPLDEIIKARGPLGEEELRSILMPLLGALEKLHAQQVYHRDIKPANILISDEGVPVLIDFGAARQRLSERSMTVIESPGYTPQEQMETRGNVGPWSDLYALAATLYRAVTLESPPKAFDRVRRDPIRHLATEFAGRYSHAFLSAIDQALRFEETERPQDSAAWSAMLAVAEVEPATTLRREPPPMPRLSREVAEPLPTIKRMASGNAHPPATARWGWLIGAAAIALAVMVIGGLILMAQPKATPQLDEATPPTPRAIPPAPGPARQLPSEPLVPKAVPLAPSDAPRTATKTNPFTNSLGMKFVPVPIGAGPSKNQRVLFSIWETRSKDYAAFMADSNRGYEMTGSNADDWRTYSYKDVPVGRGSNERAEDSTHPVQSVSWEDATAFSNWLTKTERATGSIGARDVYRLPSDVEWSYAVGIGDQENASDTPEAKDEKIADVYPWGNGFPPATIVGNYSDSTAKSKFDRDSTANSILGFNFIAGYNDGYATTAPTGNFAPNKLGIYDLGGNVCEWCDDWYNAKQNDRVFRGASWEQILAYIGLKRQLKTIKILRRDGHESLVYASCLLSSYRDGGTPSERYICGGFRVVLVVGGGSP